MASCVASDTFICGICSLTFHDLVTFLEHKQSTSCGVTVAYNPTAAAHQGNVTLLAEAPDESLPTEAPFIKVVKRKGRPKKGDVSMSVPVPVKKNPAKTASMGKDGLLCCDVCKLKFSRERHFKSHKCKSESDLYVRPDEVPELEEGFDSRIRFPVEPEPGEEAPEIQEEAEHDDDNTEDYYPRRAAAKEAGEDEEINLKHSTKQLRPCKRRNIVASDANRKLESLALKRKVASYPIPQTLDDIPDIPVFPNEEARQEFEKKEITVVDLSHTYEMYKTHVIEQTMNEHAIQGYQKLNPDISLYSCNECEKVFKSLSHIRYHCLTHIDKKPFKCPECDFRSNSKGNIYSHMRKHTKQMYRCRTCEFESVNKSHLLEHESIHSGIVHKCALCKKHYSTVKSLVNHVRNYHSKTEEGKVYYQQFVHTKEGPGAAMLFECHVCDRKFKKQSDRDRHLYVHNVRVEHTVFTCKLCMYETTKEIQLDFHCIKHKYVYCCAECDTRTISITRLVAHLNAEHAKETVQEVISPDCIAKSLYLPKERQAVLESSTTSIAAADAAANAEEASSSDIFTRLGYLPLTVEMFYKIREEEGDNECGECGLLFQTAELCEEHTDTHTGERPFECEYCDHRANSKNSLKLHINAHHEEEMFRCNQCTFISKSRVALVEHKNRHEGLNCQLCQQFVAGRKGLRNHLLAKHPEVDAESARRLSGYGRRTDAMKSGKAFKCPYCEKTFTNNNIELQKHIWAHEGIKPFKCDLCEYACRTRSNLTSHMLRHTEQKPFPCIYCGKKYKSKTALRWHERSHANGRLFKCDKCAYEGIQKSHLVRHMETHNIIKRFSCNHCCFSSNTVGYMRIHYTRAHPGVTYTQENTTPYNNEQANAGGSNVYKCVSCDYLFGNLSDMKRHLRHKHRIHMTDMTVVNGQDLVTEIVPMENQDGITSNVQIMRFPLDANMEEGQLLDPNAEASDSAVYLEDGSNIQLVGNMEIETDNGVQTIVMDYPVDAPRVVTFTAAGATSPNIFISNPGSEPTLLSKTSGISLLKSAHANNGLAPILAKCSDTPNETQELNSDEQMESETS